MTLRYLRLGNEYPVAVVDMATDLLDDCLPELVSVVLLHGLMIVHDVADHFIEERNWMAHLVLNTKMFVVALHSGTHGHIVGLVRLHIFEEPA